MNGTSQIKFDIEAPLSEISKALELAFQATPTKSKTAIGFGLGTSEDPALMFYWVDTPDIIRFIARADASDLVAMVQKWCTNLLVDTPPNQMGFRIYNGYSEHAKNLRATICTIVPVVLDPESLS